MSDIDEDIFGGGDDLTTSGDLNFDVNTDSIKPTSRRTTRPVQSTDDDTTDNTDPDANTDSLENEREAELSGLEVDDDYFSDDSWEK